MKPNSTKNITYSNIDLTVPNKQFVLRYSPIRQLEVPSPSGAEVPDDLLGFPGETVCPAKVARACLVCLWGKQMWRFRECFQLGNTTYVRLKVLTKGGSSQRTENKACSFSSVFRSCELPLSPFFLCSFLFFASDVVDLVAIWYVAFYLAPSLYPSS